MKSWFHRHPHVTLFVCAVMSIGSFHGADQAATLPGRLWLWFCFVCWTISGFQAWERT